MTPLRYPCGADCRIGDLVVGPAGQHYTVRSFRVQSASLAEVAIKNNQSGERLVCPASALTFVLRRKENVFDIAPPPRRASDEQLTDILAHAERKIADGDLVSPNVALSAELVAGLCSELLERRRA